jgi:ribosomal protein S17
VTLKKTGGKWFLVGVESIEVHPRQSERFNVDAGDKVSIAAARCMLKTISPRVFKIVPVRPGARAQQIAA